MTVVRNESAIIRDTLDHMASFCDGVVVLDDASTDGTADLCRRHEVVVEVLRRETWDRDRVMAQGRHRGMVLNAARKYGGPDDWFVYMDADERIEFDWKVLARIPEGAVRMKLFDFYITAGHLGYRYDEREWLGPEYRNILMAFKGRWGAGYGGACQREVTLRSGCRILEAGFVRDRKSVV